MGSIQLLQKGHSHHDLIKTIYAVHYEWMVEKSHKSQKQPSLLLGKNDGDDIVAVKH